MDSFREHPDAFYVYFWSSAVFDCLCVALFFVQQWLGVASGVIALLLFLFQFVPYKRAIDPLFPEKESINVTAIRPCSGEVGQGIFLDGHIDAAWEFPLNYHFGGIVFEIPGVMTVIGVVYYIALGICAICGAGSWTQSAGLVGLLFIPFFLLVGCTYNPLRIVDRANDDLSGCYMGIAVLREIGRFGVRPEHTEVGMILTGS